MHLPPKKDTAKPVASVAIFPKPENTNFISKIRTCLLENDDNNAILKANTIFPDQVYLKQWKELDKADACHNEVMVEPGERNVLLYRVLSQQNFCSDTADERCTSDECDDLLGQELTTEQERLKELIDQLKFTA